MLRRLVEREEIFVRPACYDALSAKILEQAGFQSIGLSGYATSVARLGRPDVGLTTLTETVRMCRYICNAVDIPVMVDADTGYGNAINVMRAVEEIIGAGGGGRFIEDQVAPKRCGHVAGKQLVSKEEMAGKVRAADRVRRELDADFVLMARTDARGASGGGLDDAIDRAKAYIDAGADVIFPEGLLSVAEIERFIAETSAPISYNRTGVSPLLSLEELDGLGVCMVANAAGALRAACRGLWDHLTLDGGDVGDPEIAEDHPLADLDKFLGQADMAALAEEFVPRPI